MAASPCALIWCVRTTSLPKNAHVNWLTPVPSNYGRAKGSWAGSILRIKAALLRRLLRPPNSPTPVSWSRSSRCARSFFSGSLSRGATDITPNVLRNTKLRPRPSLTRAALQASCRALMLSLHELFSWRASVLSTSRREGRSRQRKPPST